MLAENIPATDNLNSRPNAEREKEKCRIERLEQEKDDKQDRKQGKRVQ
ncbi:MAG TPA: hypothetical protein VNT99_06895 [Methylomirabilota bacterium]|nr:hypothetical protein [Methylomirabilota bacterium]